MEFLQSTVSGSGKEMQILLHSGDKMRSVASLLSALPCCRNCYTVATCHLVRVPDVSPSQFFSLISWSMLSVFSRPIPERILHLSCNGSFLVMRLRNIYPSLFFIILSRYDEIDRSGSAICVVEGPEIPKSIVSSEQQRPKYQLPSHRHIRIFFVIVLT